MTKTKPKSVREIATDKLNAQAAAEKQARVAAAKKEAERKETNARENVKNFLEQSNSALQEAFKAASDPQNAKFDATPFFNIERDKYTHGFSAYITAESLPQDALFKKFNQACKKADVQFLWDTGTCSVEIEPYDSMPRTEYYDYIKLRVDMTKPYAGAQRADMKDYRQ